MSKKSKEVRFGEHTLVMETGEIARQANGAVLVNLGGTQVLVTVVAGNANSENRSNGK